MWTFQLIAIFSLISAVSNSSFAQERLQKKNSLCLQDTAPVFKKAEWLKKQNQNLLSAQEFSIIDSFACFENEKILARIGYAQCMYRLGENFVAEQSLKSISELNPSPLLLKKSQLLRAWYDPEIRQKLGAIEQTQFTQFEKLKIDLEKTHQVKKPWLAGSLSAIIPGLGQAYNGNFQSAGISFVINALFLATALEQSQKGLHTSALAAGMIFSITYTGNILGSIESSRQINRRIQEPEIDHLRTELIPDLEL